MKIPQNYKTFISVVLICVVIFIDSNNATENLLQEKGIKKKRIRNDNVKCLTKGCNEAASTLLENMDFDVNPCSNFYEYTCGNFIKNKKIPEDKGQIATISKLEDRLYKRLLEIISEVIQPNDIQPFILTKQYFKDCMNEEKLKQRGKTPLTNILAELGGWPILEKNNWNETKFNWSETLIKLAQIGAIENIFFTIGFERFSGDKSPSVLIIGPDTVVTRKKYDQGFNSTYFEYMNNLAAALGAEQNTAREQLEEIFRFESELANVISSISMPSISNATIKELQQEYPTIPWLNYIKNMLYSMVNLKENDKVYYSSDYTKGMEKLIQITPKRVLANYIIWQVINKNVDYLSHDYYQYKNKFIKNSRPREINCMLQTVEKMTLTVSSLYMRKYITQEIKTNLMEMVTNIRSELKKTLEHVDWMDNKTKKYAMEKIDAIYIYIGASDELLNDNKLVEYYKNLTISANFYFESALKMSLFNNKKTIEVSLKPYNRTLWTELLPPNVINAYYNFGKNIIVIGTGIMQGEYFMNDRPKYMNYGGIGSAIGHEIMHGFDNSGRLYDKEGNLFDWWENSTSEVYENKIKCTIEHYEKYNIGNLTVNGTQNLGENIADIDGAKIAYWAYKRWAELNAEEPSLPGLPPLTPRQMFWISMASPYCSNSRQEYLEERFKDGHTFDLFRIHGIVSNLEEFSQDFRCPKGSPMNPEKKCILW